MILIHSSPKDALKIFQPFLPIHAPIGIGYLLAVLERDGIEAFVVDEQFENVLDRVQSCVGQIAPPYFFGFSVLTAAYGPALTCARQLKQWYPESFVCFGGPHPTALPEEVLQHQFIDAVVRGEAENVITALYRCVQSGSALDHVPNLSYRKNGEIIHTSSAPLVNVDEFPEIPYHRFNRKPYDLGFAVTSRGCPYNCIFCSNRNTTGKRYRFRNNERVLETIDLLKNKYGQKNILFLDDNFLVHKERIYHLMAEIRRRGLHRHMMFSVQGRGDNVDRDLLLELYATNVKSIFFGLETASERLMQVLQKGETVDACRKAVRMAKEIGFHVSATFMYAIPSETHQDRMACVRMGKALDLDMVRFNNCTPYPGTPLYQIARNQHRLTIIGDYANFNSVSTFIENPFDKIPFSYVPEGNTEGEIRRDLLFSYFAVYFNVKKVKDSFMSDAEGKGAGWFNSGESWPERFSKIPALILLAFFMMIKFGELALAVVFRINTKLSWGEIGQLLRLKPVRPSGRDEIITDDRSHP